METQGSQAQHKLGRISRLPVHLAQADLSPPLHPLSITEKQNESVKKEFLVGANLVRTKMSTYRNPSI